jgi:hypothetical protein
MTVKPEILWIAAIGGNCIRTEPAVLSGESFVWDTGLRRLEVVCLDSNGCSYAEARISDQGKSPDEIKRLQFFQNNVAGEFLIRVYRTWISVVQAREDFMRQVEPARFQGQN